MKTPVISAALALLIVSSQGLAGQDSLQLTDGRFVTGPTMTATDDGVVIHLQHGNVSVPSHLVKEVTVVANAGMTEGLSAADKKKVARGLVKFEGKWVSAKDRDRRVKKRAKEIQDRIAEALEHSNWEKKYVSQSKYFKFHYTIDPDIMQWWADLMDGYYKEFSSYWGGIKPPPGFGKLDVKFFHNQDYYDQVTGMAGTGGFFRFVPPLELDFYYDRLDEDWTLNVMFHEANHYLTWLMAPKYKFPTWLNEGMAEYYGASIWDPKKKKLEVGGLLEGRLANVQQEILGGTWVGLEELINVPHSSFSGRYYGWAWTLVHYLMHSKKYKKNFKKMVRAFPRDESQDRERLAPGGYNMTQHPPSSQIPIIKKFLKVKSLDALEKEWHDYIKQLEPASARGFFAFGKTALRDGMPIKATRMLKKALDMGYDSPMLYINYAKALQQRPKKDKSARQADYRQAVDYVEKAIEKDPVNPLFRARYAKVLNDLARILGKGDPRVKEQRSVATELGEYVNGGYDSYSVFLALDWKVYGESTSAGGE